MAGRRGSARWPTRCEKRHGTDVGRLVGTGRGSARARDSRRERRARRLLTAATSIADVVALARGAAVMVSGDTGPTHIAAAVGTPIVGIYGPDAPGAQRSRGARATRPSRATRSASVIISAGASWIGCACWTSRSPKCWPRSNAGWLPTRPCLIDNFRDGISGAPAGPARMGVCARSCSGSRILSARVDRRRCGDRGWPARRFASGPPDICNKAREVTSSGPYRWFAHPLYVGSSIMGAGLGDRVAQPDRVLR